MEYLWFLLLWIPGIMLWANNGDTDSDGLPDNAELYFGTLKLFDDFARECLAIKAVLFGSRGCLSGLLRKRLTEGILCP